MSSIEIVSGSSGESITSRKGELTRDKNIKYMMVIWKILKLRVL
jgi:hypothetical protein